MNQSIPPLMTEIMRSRELLKNPRRINSYSSIVQSMFPNGIESVKDHSMNKKEKIQARSKSIDDELTLIQD